MQSNFYLTLFRCSGLGHLMTEAKSKTETLSEGTKTHLMDVYIREKYQRQSEISNKYVQKGNEVEEDSITLYSLLKKIYFKKNEDTLKNSFIAGTPDLYIGETITNADKIIDIKSSWDIYTFFRVLTKSVNSLYWWQLQGYMALSGAKEATLAYCLVNTPASMLNDEKIKLKWRMNVIDERDTEYVEKCQLIERNGIFDMDLFEKQNPGFDLHTTKWSYDIPREERLIEFHFERDDEKIKMLYSRIKDCRIYLNNLNARMSK